MKVHKNFSFTRRLLGFTRILYFYLVNISAKTVESVDIQLELAMFLSNTSSE